MPCYALRKISRRVVRPAVVEKSGCGWTHGLGSSRPSVVRWPALLALEYSLQRNMSGRRAAVLLSNLQDSPEGANTDRWMKRANLKLMQLHAARVDRARRHTRALKQLRASCQKPAASSTSSLPPAARLLMHDQGASLCTIPCGAKGGSSKDVNK